MVGELLCRTVRSPGAFGVVTGSLQTEDHADKVEGFRSTVKTLDPEREIAFIIETQDDPRVAYARTASLLSERRDLCGLYIGTANSLPVLQAIDDSGLGDQIRVISTDLFPALVPLIRSGRVLATIHQRPKTQGRLAFQALYQFLLEGKYPSPTIRVVPHIVMASNLDMFADGHFVDAVQEFGARPGIH
jgi:LacI family transcriptional regulator